MKDYKEIADSVLRRGLEEMEKNRKRRSLLLRAGGAAAAFGLVAAISAGTWYGRKSAQGKDLQRQSAGAALDQGGMPEKGNGMDGDPAGYSTGSDKNSDSEPMRGGNPSGYDAVSEGGDGELDRENIVEDAKLAWVEGAVGPDGESGGTEEGTKETISSYPEDAIYCYMAPKNGEFFCSAPLVHAMEEYGDEVLYRVAVEFFCDEDRIAPRSGEEKLAWERFFELDYTVVRENCDDGQTKQPYFMLLATRKQLEGFAAGEEYGYFFRFQDEP